MTHTHRHSPDQSVLLVTACPDNFAVFESIVELAIPNADIKSASQPYTVHTTLQNMRGIVACIFDYDVCGPEGAPEIYGILLHAKLRSHQIIIRSDRSDILSGRLPEAIKGSPVYFRDGLYVEVLIKYLRDLAKNPHVPPDLPKKKTVPSRPELSAAH